MFANKACQLIAQVLIRISKRDPADKLTGADSDKLLVAMFAWDGNSYVGNEYWGGSLSASGSEFACCFFSRQSQFVQVIQQRPVAR